MNARLQKGFSLIELMIVVGIIGVLATIAVPKFQQFQAKAKMSEAKINLNQISTLEESYNLDNNGYANMALMGRQASNTPTCNDFVGGVSQIGFTIEPCQPVATSDTPRFGYRVVVGGGATTYIATANTNAMATNLVCPGIAALVYNMSETRIMSGGPGAAVGGIAPYPALWTCSFAQ